MEENRQRYWRRFTLKYLLLETTLWALVCGAWLLAGTRFVDVVGLEVYTIGLQTVLGAAIGGLIGRPGVGAFVGFGNSVFIVIVMNMTHGWDL